MGASKGPSRSFLLVLLGVAGGLAFYFGIWPAYRIHSKTHERLAKLRTAYVDGVQKYLPEIRRDLVRLDADPLFAPGPARRDVGGVLKVDEPLNISGAARAAYSDESLDEDNFAKIEALELPDTEMAWFGRLPEFDHWNFGKAPAIAAMSPSDYVLKGRTPNIIPMNADLKIAVALRLITASRLGTEEAAKASREVKSLARLLLTTENLFLGIVASSVLETERNVSAFATARSLPGAPGLAPLPNETLDALDRIVQPLPAILGPFADDGDVSKVFAGRGPSLIDCIGLEEAVSSRLLSRVFLKDELARQNAELTRLLEATKGKCRLERLREIWADDDFMFHGMDSADTLPWMLLKSLSRGTVGWMIVSLGNVSSYR